MGKYYTDEYIEFIRNSIKNREKERKKLFFEIRLFEEEMHRIIKKEMEK